MMKYFSQAKCSWPRMLKCLTERAVGQRGVRRVPVRVPQWVRLLWCATHVRTEETMALCWMQESGCLCLWGIASLHPQDSCDRGDPCTRSTHTHILAMTPFPWMPQQLFECLCLQVSIKRSLYQPSTLWGVVNNTVISSAHPNQKQCWLYLKPVTSEVRWYFQLLQNKTWQHDIQE